MSRQQITSGKIREQANKQLAERYNQDAKLGGAAPTLQTFNPPIIRSTPIAPDPKLKGRIAHGSR